MISSVATMQSFFKYAQQATMAVAAGLYDPYNVLLGQSGTTLNATYKLSYLQISSDDKYYALCFYGTASDGKKVYGFHPIVVYPTRMHIRVLTILHKFKCLQMVNICIVVVRMLVGFIIVVIMAHLGHWHPLVLTYPISLVPKMVNMCMLVTMEMVLFINHPITA